MNEPAIKYRPVYCPLQGENGQICNAHLIDVEPDREFYFSVHCRRKHGEGKKANLFFQQHVNGVLEYRELGLLESKNKRYDPDTIRTQSE